MLVFVVIVIDDDDDDDDVVVLLVLVLVIFLWGSARHSATQVEEARRCESCSQHARWTD